jgi:hypothetical protein
MMMPMKDRGHIDQGRRNPSSQAKSYFFKNSFIKTQPQSFVYRLPVAVFAVLGQS